MWMYVAYVIKGAIWSQGRKAIAHLISIAPALKVVVMVGSHTIKRKKQVWVAYIRGRWNGFLIVPENTISFQIFF